jgi:hypothetical protein
VTRHGLAVGTGIGIDLPVDRTAHQHVDQPVARHQAGRAPAEREHHARRPPPQRIGGRDREADDPARAFDRMAFAERGEEGALAIGGPAVAAGGGIGFGRRRDGLIELHVQSSHGDKDGRALTSSPTKGGRRVPRTG